MRKGYFITAIGTDSGKTFISAIVTEALKADYWKPVQAGFPTDSNEIKRLVTNENTTVLEERYVLNTPASPHAAAKIDKIEIGLSDFELPVGEGPIVVEGAGGILVPINDNDTVGDLMKHLDLPVILVSNLYLGNINHTLLSAQYLKASGMEVAGIIFNGPSNPESERIIEKMTGYPVLFKVPQEEDVSPEIVKKYAEQIQESEFIKKMI